jgi:hypothetical protein
MTITRYEYVTANPIPKRGANWWHIVRYHVWPEEPVYNSEYEHWDGPTTPVELTDYDIKQRYGISGWQGGPECIQKFKVTVSET